MSTEHSATIDTRYSTVHGSPWIFIAGSRVLVAIRTPSEPDVVERLWSVVRGDDATIDQAAALIPPVTSGTPTAFAVIERSSDAGSTAVLVHGEAAVDVETSSGWRRVGSGGEPWRREDVAGASAYRAGILPASPGVIAESISFPFGAGVVISGRIDTVIARQAEPAPSEQAPTAQVERPDPSASAAILQSVLPQAAPSITHAPAAAMSPAETDTIIRPKQRTDDDPLLRHDGQTILRRDIAPPIEDETILRQAPFVSNDPKTLLYGFRINGGEAYPLDSVHYFGRNPRQPRIPLPDPSRLVPVVSASKSVSATHLEVKQIGDSIVATDLKSTNGTSVILPGAHWQRLRAGESVVVVPGTFIDIGDGNVIEILPPWPGV